VKRNTEMFSLLPALESEEGYKHVQSLIDNHLKKLQSNITHYIISLLTQLKIG
jgi:hypothetical protein